MLATVKDWTTTSMAERLIWMTEHFGVAARQLSKQAGLSFQHAQQIISGEQSGMKGPSATRYADRWKVDLRWLISGTGQPLPAIEAHEPHQPALEAAPKDATSPGRWRGYAERYWTFRAEATIAIARGVPEAALDAAADSLGAHHGAPTEEQAQLAIERYRARIQSPARDAKEIRAGREATDADFQVASPIQKKGNRR